MVAIVEYGVGNLFSLISSLERIGEEVVVSSDKDTLEKADQIILPGVGAFKDARRKLEERGLDKLLVELAGKGKPILGICLGMQLLFEKSYEFGKFPGLGLLKGSVVPFEGRIDESLKIPQIGWNSLTFISPSPLFKYIKDGSYVYFVHSYYATGCQESLKATTEYGTDVTAVVQKDNVYGCQFHPEKSGEVGLAILKAFCEIGKEV